MSEKARRWLKQELPAWEREGLIVAAQADALRQRYRLYELEGGGFWRHLISAAGAILVGLGVILLFAYNWAEMGKALKLAVVFGSMGLFHGGGYRLRARNPLLSEGLFAIGSMLMGAGIFLVGQIYHLDSHYPDALLLWAVGVMALAWALPSRIQAWMALILITVWHLSEVMDFARTNLWVFLPLGLLWLLVWVLQSPMLARFSSVVLLTVTISSLMILDHESLLVVVLSLLLLLAALPGLVEAIGRPRLRPLAEAMAGPALAVLVLFLLAVTLENFSDRMIFGNGPSRQPLYWGSLLLGQSVLLFLWLRGKGRLDPALWLTEAVLLLVLLPQLLAPMLGEDYRGWLWAAQNLLVNLLTLGLSLWMMISGAGTVNRRRLVWGALLFAVLVVMRYLDLFDSLIARGLVFLALGAGLFALSHWYRRNQHEAES
jgi:uncharacterized membrane protein